MSTHRTVQVGSFVRHSKFGLGHAKHVVHCPGTDGYGQPGCRCEATIAFEVGEKRLLLRYAPVEVLAGRHDFDSPPELRLYLNMVAAGMPLPAIQYRIGRYRVDLAYPVIKLAIEVDGLEFHGSQQAFIKDQKRQRDIQNEGWTVIRFATKEVNINSSGCVQEIARMASRMAAEQ